MDMGSGHGRWLTNPILRRKSVTSASLLRISCPFTSTLPSNFTPSVVSIRRLSVRNRVDFPHPDGPMMQVICFSGNVTFTFFKM